MASHAIFRFYAELVGYEPKIWRRFELMEDATVARLAYVVMALFEMKASHLFAVEVLCGENLDRVIRLDPWKSNSCLSHESYLLERERIHRFEVPHEYLEWIDDSPQYELFDATAYKIRDVVSEYGDRINVEYDFGDGWLVALTLERVYRDADLPGKELPRVLEGEGFGIVEDCGGIGGLDEVARALKGHNTERGEELREWLEWLGEDIDLKAFDIDDLNYRVKKLPRIFMRAYEQGAPPTKQSLDLLERKYL